MARTPEVPVPALSLIHQLYNAGRTRLREEPAAAPGLPARPGGRA